MTRRISITTLILLMTIVALSVALYSTYWRLRIAEVRLMISESRQSAGWPDPDAINAIVEKFIDLHPGFQPSRGSANLGWRLQLPNDQSHELHWETVGGLSGKASTPLLAGRSALAVSITDSRDGELSIQWGNERLPTLPPPHRALGWTTLFYFHQTHHVMVLPHRHRLADQGQLFKLYGYALSLTGAPDPRASAHKQVSEAI